MIYLIPILKLIVFCPFPMLLHVIIIIILLNFCIREKRSVGHTSCSNQDSLVKIWIYAICRQVTREKEQRLSCFWCVDYSAAGSGRWSCTSIWLSKMWSLHPGLIEPAWIMHNPALFCHMFWRSLCHDRQAEDCLDHSGVKQCRHFCSHMIWLWVQSSLCWISNCRKWRRITLIILLYFNT